MGAIGGLKSHVHELNLKETTHAESKAVNALGVHVELVSHESDHPHHVEFVPAMSNASRRCKTVIQIMQLRISLGKND